MEKITAQKTDALLTKREVRKLKQAYKLAKQAGEILSDLRRNALQTQNFEYKPSEKLSKMQEHAIFLMEQLDAFNTQVAVPRGIAARTALTDEAEFEKTRGQTVPLQATPDEEEYEDNQDDDLNNNDPPDPQYQSENPGRPGGY